MSREEIIIRPAQISDALRIREIYLPYIMNTVFNLEEKIESEYYYATKIAKVSDHFPFLVAEQAGRVIGFVYASEVANVLFLNKSCALSIYVAEDANVKGLGQLLLNAVEEELVKRSYTHLIANIVTSNTRSLKFHEKNGFSLLCQFPHAGYKFNQWHDVSWYGKQLASPIEANSFNTFESDYAFV